MQDLSQRVERQVTHRLEGQEKAIEEIVFLDLGLASARANQLFGSEVPCGLPCKMQRVCFVLPKFH